MCGIVTYFGGAGNNLTRLLTGMSSIIYRAPDSTGIAAFGDDTEPIRLRKAVGSMTQLLDRLHQRGIYPCPERHLATFRTDEGEADDTSRQQKQLLLFEGVTLEYFDGIQDGSLSYLNFDDLVNPDPGQQKRLCPGWPGAPLSHPRFVIRTKKDLVTLIQHLITEFDLSPTVIQFIIRHALQRTIDGHAARDSLEIRAEDILRTFDEIYEKIITRERISPPRRLNYGFPAKSLFPHRYVWRYLIESPIEIPSDYDRDGVRCVFRLLDAALLSRLPFDSVLSERVQKILDTFWPESQRTVPVEWRSLYAAEKGINVFGWAAATALTYLQREEFLPAFLNSHPNRQLISAEAIVAGQTDPVSLRYFSQPVMAHGRWAIQSAVTEKNAHPFTDERRQRVIVLNGQFDSQVEEQTRRFLEEVAGVSFRSENSAEYFALLWGYYADLLHREQRHSNSVRSHVETSLENYAIGSQAMDYGVYRQVEGKSTDQIDQMALIEAAIRMCRNGGQLAAAAMSLRSPRKMYVVSHNRPVYVVHRLDNDDFMVVSDINAAMGLFPQELIQEKTREFQEKETEFKAATALLDSDNASPDKFEALESKLREEKEAFLEAFRVAVYPLEGERLFACIESVLAEDSLSRRLSLTDFDGRPLTGIEPFITLLNPVQFRKDFQRSFYETHLSEIPERLNEILRFYQTDTDRLLDFGIRSKLLRRRFGRTFGALKRIVLIGTGSSYNMGWIAQPFIRSLLPETDILLLRPGETEDLSSVIVPEKDLVLLLSWSSTTADMVKTARQLLDLNVIMVGITEKTFADMALIAYKSGGVVPILSGEEVTVSGVKSTICMLFCLELFCTWLAAVKGRRTDAQWAMENLKYIPTVIEEVLRDENLKAVSEELARRYADGPAAVVIDAQQSSGAGQEIALKLEENSWSAIGKTLDYSEALPFIENESPTGSLVIVNATCEQRLDEAVAIMEKLHHRRMKFLAVSISHRQQELVDRYSDGNSIYLKRLGEDLQPFVNLVFYYQFAFYFGLARGREIGVPPRNRAKSLTVSRSLKMNHHTPVERVEMLQEVNQASSPTETVIERAGKKSEWEDCALNDTERLYYRNMRRLSESMARPVRGFSRLEGLDADAAERLHGILFSDTSDIEEIVSVPLDRSAEAAVRVVTDQWRTLIELPFSVMTPWEVAAHVPDGALLIIAAAAPPSVGILDMLLANTNAPFVWVGPEASGAFLSGSDNCIGLFSDTAVSGFHNVDLLYSRMNELLIRVWGTVAPDKAAVVGRHVQMSAQIILSVLNNADLLHDIRRAITANTAYTTAFFIGPPNGTGLAWVECFDQFSPVILEHHPYGHSAHGPLVTVDPRVEHKFIKLESRDIMSSRYGTSRVLEWEKTYLDGNHIDAFLNQRMMSLHKDPQRPFFAEESWYLPILQPDYQTMEDNLIILDTTSSMYFHQAVDELATFGCRYPRMIVLSQAAFESALKEADIFKFPISDVILLPGIPSGQKVLSVSGLQLPYCLNLVVMAMASATRQAF